MSTVTLDTFFSTLIASPLPEWTSGQIVQFTAPTFTTYGTDGKATYSFATFIARPGIATIEPFTPTASPSPPNTEVTTKPTAATTPPQASPPSKPSSSTRRIGSSPPIVSTGETSSSPTASSTASQTPSPINSAQAAGLGSGAIAGIAIGCVIAGLIIGAVAALCLLRRRQDKHTVPEYLPMKYSSGEKVLPLAPVSDKLQLDQFLLDSKPDADIAAELQSLGQLIQQHVENNYHLQPVQRSPNVLAQTLVQLGLYEQDSSAAISLASLAVDPRTRWAALQHVISRVTFASSSLDGHSPISLLPPFSGAFVQTLPPIESHRGSSEGGYNVLSHPLVHSLT